MRAAGEAWRLSTCSSDSGGGGSSGVVHCSVSVNQGVTKCSRGCFGYIRIGITPRFCFLFVYCCMLVDIQVACTLERDGE